LRNRSGALARWSEGVTGLTASRPLPEWARRPFRDEEGAPGGEVALIADCFNRYFEPETLRAALAVFKAAGIGVEVATGAGRPLCCGRTFLSVGLVEEARTEAKRLIAALLPLVERGLPVIGLEPSCLLTLRDEIPALLPGPEADRLAGQAKMLEEYLAERAEAGRLSLSLASPAPKVLLHGHCHQKAMGVMSSIERVLALLPDTEVETVESSCCGMAGAFGYGRETHEISRQMAELDLMPAVRAAEAETLIVADGTSCRHQIADLSDRQPVHVARVLERAIAAGCQA
ncbi:MAG: heterodisulfide reductase-related iron-sulfur binding cluster, partial [Pseudomonadota bacterium]